jgi:hypothetical protein
MPEIISRMPRRRREQLIHYFRLMHRSDLEFQIFLYKKRWFTNLKTSINSFKSNIYLDDCDSDAIDYKDPRPT